MSVVSYLILSEAGWTALTYMSSFGGFIWSVKRDARTEELERKVARLEQLLVKLQMEQEEFYEVDSDDMTNKEGH